MIQKELTLLVVETKMPCHLLMGCNCLKELNVNVQVLSHIFSSIVVFTELKKLESSGTINKVTHGKFDLASGYC